MAADSQSSSQLGDLSKYIGVDLVTPTEKEARIEMKDETSGLVVLAENLRNKLACKNVILKLGADGILIHGINEIQNTKIETDQINALNINPQSISGAGDSLMAGAALSLASGANIYESAYIGSAVAALHVSKDGNLPVEKSKLVELIELI
jgi:bifunctional ADP-heptose synthase (sugar kinase/adenylyltransferase)